MNVNKNDVGLRIKKIRKLLKINQEDFLKCLKIKETSLSHYETGKKYPPFEFLVDIATHYNVSVEYLVFGIGDPFLSEDKNFDDFWMDKPFGDYTEGVKELFRYMRHSMWVRGAVMTFFKEYLSKNKEDIEKDILLNDNKEEER